MEKKVGKRVPLVVKDIFQERPPQKAIWYHSDIKLKMHQILTEHDSRVLTFTWVFLIQGNMTYTFLFNFIDSKPCR